MQAATRRMDDLIEGLLTLARVAKADLQAARVDVSVQAAEVVEELRDADPERSVDVVIQPNMHAAGDRVLVRAALLNLIGNAWKFTARCPAPRISIGTETRENGERVFFVKDNGAGFDMAYAPRLFSVFERLHSQEDFPGTGVGLATVQRIVARHGGRIWAEGRPGDGATFFFTLPK
jgi:light-regulated signal transduction histidine kinase (bacteriophytochrome)